MANIRSQAYRFLSKNLLPLVMPFIIISLAFHAYALHGMIDTLESGLYLSCANGVFHGEIPYRDFIPPVGPLAVWTISAFMAIFGKSLYILRWFFHSSTITMYIILYFTGRSLFRSKWTAALLPIIALVETFNPFWSTRWAGYGRMGVGLIGLWAQLNAIEKKDTRSLIMAGAATATTLLYSIDYGIFLILTGGILCISMAFYKPAGSFHSQCRLIIKKIFAFIAGMAIPFIPFTVYMCATHSFAAYIKDTYLLISHHVPAWKTTLPGFFDTLAKAPSLITFLLDRPFRIYLARFIYSAGAIYIMYRLFTKKDRRETLKIALFLVFGFLSYLSGCRVFLGPQFDVAFLPVIMLMLYSVEKSVSFLHSQLRKNPQSFLLRTVSACIIIAMIPLYLITSEKRVYSSWPLWGIYQINKDTLIPLYNSLQPVSRIPMALADMPRIGATRAYPPTLDKLKKITQYLRAHTAPGEAVFTFPEHGLYNFLADRPTVGRFYTAISAHTVTAWSQELLADLSAHPPRYIVYSLSLSNAAKNIGMKKELLPEISEFIETHYHPEFFVGAVGIYRHNE